MASSKDRGGLSKREYEAKQKGGNLNYKTGRITVPQKVVVQPQKKVTYDMNAGKATVVSKPKAIGQNRDGSYIYDKPSPTPKAPTKPTYGPQIPASFKQQVNAVKNYSSVTDGETEEQKRRRREEAVRKSKAESERYSKESSTKGIFKNTVSGLGGATKKVASFLGGVGKTVARSPVTVPTKTMLTLSNKKEYRPESKVEKFLVGDEPVTSYTEDQARYTKSAKEKGLSKGKSILAGAGLAIGSVGLDIGTGGKGKAVTGAIKKGAKDVLERVGKSVAKSGEDEAGSAVGRAIAQSGRQVRDAIRTPRAEASFDETFTPATKSSYSLADSARASKDDVLRTKRPKVADEIPEGRRVDEPVQTPEKPPVDRTKVAKLRESEAALREKVAKALEDAKGSVDELDDAGNVVKRAKDPTEEINQHIGDFKKEFEDLTGEKAPDDVDELITRIRGIETENQPKWVKQDKTWRRQKELQANAGVKVGPTYARGSKRSVRGKFGGKTGGKRKGILVEARAKTAIKRDTENYKKSLLATLSQRAAAIQKELRLENSKPKLDLDRIAKLQDELDQDIPAMHRDIRAGKLTDEDLYFIGEDMRKKGHDPFRVQTQGERTGVLPGGKEPAMATDRRSLNSVPLKKDDGAIRQIATDDFRFHTTSEKFLDKIKKEGLKPSQGQYGKGVYFAPDEARTQGYGSAEGMMIRVKKSKLPKDYDEFPEQGWTENNVPPEALEYRIKGSDKWEPMVPAKTPVKPKLVQEIEAGTPDVPRGTDIPPMPKKGPIKQWANEVGTTLREVVQDNWIRVKKLQSQPNVKVDPSKLTPYEAETLFHGRVGHRITEANDTLKAIDKEIADLEKSTGNKELRKDIDKYLIARHAPERNAVHGEGAAGMTDDEAKEIVKAFEGDSKNKAAIETAKKIRQANDQTLDILRDAQVIDDEMYKTLRETYKEHVPLNRIFEETDDVFDALAGKGFSVKGSGIKKAKGSDLEVDDLLSNVGANLEQAIVRAEKNRVNLATLEFARENKHLGLFKEIQPPVIGKTFDGRPLFAQVDDPLVLTIRENGKPVHLRIADERLATVFKGIGNEKLPPVLNFVGAFTRLYSGLATRFNPEFVFSNKLRDLQEMAVYMSAQKDIGFTGATKTMLRDPASMKDVVAHMRGKNTPGAKLYKQMMEDGGTTGGQALSTRKQLKIDLESMRRLNRGGILNMRKQGKNIIDAFDSWNQIFEDSTRLSVYKSALDRGLSRERAAMLAKNATINFNKKGTGGPVINALYMFSNASIQGTTKLLTAMKNPKVAAAVTGTVGTSVWAVNNWNDKVDPDWRDKVSEWDRNSNMVVMIPGEEGAKYFTIPVSWGLKPMKVMADLAYDASNGHASEKSILDMTGKVLSSVWDAYNPAGGTDAVSAAVPSFLDIPVEIARNMKWSGSKMRPEAKEGVPDSEAFFQNKEGVPSDKSKTFGVLRAGTKFLADASGGEIQINPANLKYALDGYLSGLGRFGTGVIETGAAATKAELPQAADLPFARRFYKEKTEEEITKAQKYDARDDLREKLKKMKPEEQAGAIQEYLNALPPEERKGAAYGLFQEGFKTKGTTTSDDVIRMKPLVDKVNALEEEGKYDEVDAIIEGLSEEDLKSFKNAAKSVKAKATKEQKEALKPKLDPIVDQIIALEDAGEYDKSDELFYSLSEEEQKVAQSLIKSR